MTYPSKPETIVMLEAWKAQHAAIEAVMHDIETAFGSIPDSPLFNVSWESFDLYTETLQKLLGADTWMEWFQAENDMGERGHEAGYDGQLFKIRTLDDLYVLIEIGRERA